jgi:hypothetical protein
MWFQKLDPIFSIGNDIMRPAYNFEPKYWVTTLTTAEWTKEPGSPLVVKGLVWYTDGARMQGVGGTGAGVYGQFLSPRLSISLGIYVTVFQAETQWNFVALFPLPSFSCIYCLPYLVSELAPYK